MIESFTELRFYNIKPVKIIYYLIIFFIILFLVSSLKKINNYEIFNLIKNNGDYYITCDSNCYLIKNGNEIYYRNNLYPYKIIDESKNIFKIHIEATGKFKGVSEVGILKERTIAIKNIFNIFKEKGVL